MATTKNSTKQPEDKFQYAADMKSTPLALLQSKLNFFLAIGIHESKLLNEKIDGLMIKEVEDSLKNVLTMSAEEREASQSSLDFGRDFDSINDSMSTRFEYVNLAIGKLKGYANIAELESEMQSLNSGLDGLVESCFEVLSNGELLNFESDVMERKLNEMSSDMSKCWDEDEVASLKFQAEESKLELEKDNAKLGSVLSMLKSLSYNHGTISEEERVGEEYVVEFEAIKNALKSREDQVEDMKKKVECLEHSVAESKKSMRKSFFQTAIMTFVAAAAAFAAHLAKER